MIKQRAPFDGGGMVIARAANEFVPTIRFSDEVSAAKDGNDFVTCPEDGERNVESG
ncbi:MAG: hypothetical protein ACREDS_13585 [Limisphaerales bacterium]